MILGGAERSGEKGSLSWISADIGELPFLTTVTVDTVTVVNVTAVNGGVIVTVTIGAG